MSRRRRIADGDYVKVAVEGSDDPQIMRVAGYIGEPSYMVEMPSGDVKCVTCRSVDALSAREQIDFWKARAQTASSLSVHEKAHNNPPPRVAGYTAKCSSCDFSETFDGLSQVEAQSEMADIGWSLMEGTPICPSCSNP